MSESMVTLKIDGQDVTVKAGTSVIEAAAQHGVVIPHYCYHPDLSVAGVCRMCVVEVENAPRLQVACNLAVTPGMVVKTTTPKVKEAVKGALELHLINHPLDCPICDKAGECKLQDYYTKDGLYESRMEYDDKVHKSKVVDIGPIVLDSERCILCTRCVRFTSEVTKTHELGIFNRGDRSELRTYDGGKLRNEYSGNLADICPVGALTAKDFRFQCRVWFLDKANTVCTLCARGCNTTVSVNATTHRLYRVEPRRNPEVNKSWICDRGRWDYHYVYAESRFKNPRKQVDGRWLDASWNEAFREIHASFLASPEKVVVGLSSHLTNEEIADAFLTLKKLGVNRFVRVLDEEVVNKRFPVDGILRHEDESPNAMGLERVSDEMAVKLLDYKALGKEPIDSLTAVLVLGVEGENPQGLAEFLALIPPTVKRWVHATSGFPGSDTIHWVLPNVTGFEKSGTLVNALGRAQKLERAIHWQGLSRDCHAVLFGLSRGNDTEICPSNRMQELFDGTTAAMIYPGARMNWAKMSASGVHIGEKVVCDE